MTLYIDPPEAAGHGRMWSHLASDTSFEELHAFARELGIPERGFDHDHYDVPAEWYGQVLALGVRADLLARADPQAPGGGIASTPSARCCVDGDPGGRCCGRPASRPAIWSPSSVPPARWRRIGWPRERRCSRGGGFGPGSSIIRRERSPGWPAPTRSGPSC